MTSRDLGYRSFAGVMIVLLWAGCAIVTPGGGSAFARQCGVDVMRPYPSPFAGIVAFSSDIDMQMIDGSVAIHRLMNERLGLPISDSAWGQSSIDQGQSSFFLAGQSGRNRAVSKLTGEPAHLALLRMWHEGSFDHFHGWQADDRFGWRFDFGEGAPLAGNSLSLAWPQQQFSDPFPSNVVIFTTAALPRNSTLQLHVRSRDGEIRRIALPVADAQVSVTEKTRQRQYTWFMSKTLGAVAATLNGSQAVGLSLEGASAIEASPLVQHVLFTDFSRLVFLDQARALRTKKVAPWLHTDHGGWTQFQNVSNLDELTVLSRTAPLIAPPRNNWRRPLASLPGSFAFTADLGANFGQRYSVPLNLKASDGPVHMAIGPLSTPDEFIAEDSERIGNAPAVRPLHSLLLIPRTKIRHGRAPLKKPEELIEFLLGIEPSLGDVSDQDLKQFFCGPKCNTAQGDAVPALIATSLAMLRQHKPVEHLWYTHFGSGGDPDVKRSLEQPLSPLTVKWLHRLAAAYYGMDWPGSARPWVTSATTFVHYTRLRRVLADALRVESAESVVSIRRVQDRETGRREPDGRRPDASLHGFTFPVDDPARAEVTVDGIGLKYVMPGRDPVCGHSTVTIIDTNTPTTIIGTLPAARLGAVGVRAGSQVPCTSTDCGRLGFQASSAGEVDASVDVRQPLSVNNSPYILVDLGRSHPDDVDSLSGLAIEITTSGGPLLIADRRRPGFVGAYLPLDLSFMRRNAYILLPLYDADWSSVTACKAEQREMCGIPSGWVTGVRIVAQARPAAALTISRLAFLRPDPMQIDNNEHTVVIAGRLIRGSATATPPLKVALEFPGDGQTRLATVDDDGVFVFSDVPQDRVARLSLQGSRPVGLFGAATTPCQAGPEVWLSTERSRADLVLEPGDCR